MRRKQDRTGGGMEVLKKIYQELVLIRKEQQAIREILEQKSIIEKSCIHGVVDRMRSDAIVRNGADREV